MAQVEKWRAFLEDHRISAVLETCISACLQAHIDSNDSSSLISSLADELDAVESGASEQDDVSRHMATGVDRDALHHMWQQYKDLYENEHKENVVLQHHIIDAVESV